MKATGKGRTVYCGFLPGLSYFKPAIPLRPVDRGTINESMDHFIPTAFHPAASALVGSPAADIELPVTCSNSLVESGVIESKLGRVVPLVNWSGGPVKDLTVTVRVGGQPRDAKLASGRPLHKGEKPNVYILDLDVADALILR
jgi:hypothetical protein